MSRKYDGVKRFFRKYSDEVKLFLTFFLIFLLFIQWIGANENSRLNLTRSIAEEGKFNIDTYANNTEDKVFYDRHFYSDKEPIPSILGMPAYLLAKTVFTPQPGRGEIEKARDFLGQRITTPFHLPLYLAVAQILFVVLLGVIPGALLVVFIKRYVARYYSDTVAVATAALIGGGTIVFFYSTTALATVLGALFAFLSVFYADAGKGFVAGVFAVFAAFTVYYMAVFPAVLLAFLVWRKQWYMLKQFLLGGFIGAAPALVYYGAVAGGDFVSFALKTIIKVPLEGSQETANTFVSVSSFSSLIGLLRNLPYLGVVVAKLLVYPVRGLFFYSPVLLLAFVALRWRESLRGGGLKYFGFALLGVTIIANASLDNWFAGASFGPRYLAPTVPFLCLPVAHAIEEGGRKMWGVAAGLGVVGAFQNMVGTLGAFFPAFEDRLILRGDAAFNLDVLAGALQPFSTHLYWQQVEQFLAWGANYRIVSRLLSGLPLDIRTVVPPGKADIALMKVGSSTVTYSLEWAFIPLAGAIVFFVWRREIGEIVKEDWKQRVVIGAAVMALLVPLSVQSAAFTSGFPYPESGGWRWMEEGGTVSVGVGRGMYRTRMNISSFNASRRNVSMRTNGQEIATVAVSDSSQGVSMYFMSKDRRVVDIGIRSKPGCAVDYASCLSVGVSDVSVGQVDEEAAVQIDNSFEGITKSSGRILGWKGKKATFTVVSSYDGTLYLRLNASRFETDHVLVSAAGEWRKISLGSGIIETGLNIERGVTTVALYPSFGFGSGFYREEVIEGERLRWASNHIRILLSEEEGIYRPKMEFFGSFEEERNVSVLYKGGRLESVSVAPGGGEKNLSTLFALSSPSVLELKLDPIPRCRFENLQGRCISFALQDAELREREKEVGLLSSDEWFYRWETDEYGRFRWMKQNVSMRLVADEERKLTIELDGRSFEEENLVIEVNGDNRTVYLSNTFTRQNISFKLQEGINTIRMYPDGCTVPSEISAARDARCLSAAFRNISLTIGETWSDFRKERGDFIWFRDREIIEGRSINPLSYEDGFYGWESGGEGRFRWLKEKTSFTLFAEKNGWVRVEAEGASFRRNGVNISVDGRRASLMFPGTFDNASLWFRVDTGRNRIDVSPMSCVRPANLVEESKDGRCLSTRFRNITLTPYSMQNGPDYTKTNIAQTDVVANNGATIISFNRPDDRLGDESYANNSKTSVVPSRRIVLRRGQWRETIAATGTDAFIFVATAGGNLTVKHTGNPVCLGTASEYVCSKETSVDANSTFLGNSVDLLNRGEGFYGWESGGEGRFRWLREGASKIVVSERRMNATVRGEGWSFAGHGAMVSVNGEEQGLDLSSKANEINMSVPLEEGKNVIRLLPRNCSSPADISDSNDTRCLSAGFSELEIVFDKAT